MDSIFIKDLEVYCHHGILKEETVLGQKFLVSLKLFTDTRKAGTLDDIEFSVDYAKVSHFVKEKMENTNYKLIEAVAEHLAKDILMEFSLVRKIQIEIKKPWAPILLPLDTVSVKIERGWTKVYLSIGSNLGDKEKNIKDALCLLKQNSEVKNVEVSSLIQTKPYGNVKQDDFLNGAVELETLKSPEDLLDLLHEIEKQGKRERTIHWGPRTIDLDILFYGDDIVQKKDLVIPHIDMINREFVLEPLREIAPYMVHPVYNKTVTALYDELKKGTEE